MAQRSNLLVQERYAEQVEADIKTRAPLFANNTLADVGYVGTPLPRPLDVLPAALPYPVLSFTPWTTGGQADVADLPATHRYRLVLTVKNSAGTGLATTTLQMPDLALKRLTLSFQGENPTAQAALDTWKGNPDEVVPSSFNVVPVIKAEGVDQVVGTVSVNFATVNNQLEMALWLDEDSTTSALNQVTYVNIQASNYHALQAFAFQVSDRLLRERSARLLASVSAIPNPNSNQEETEGELLHLAGLKYMRYISEAAKRIGELDGGSGESGPHLGLTSTRMKVSYVFDQPFAAPSVTGAASEAAGGVRRAVPG